MKDKNDLARLIEADTNNSIFLRTTGKNIEYSCSMYREKIRKYLIETNRLRDIKPTSAPTKKTAKDAATSSTKKMMAKSASMLQKRKMKYL